MILFILSVLLGALGRRVAGGVMNEDFKARLGGDYPVRAFFGLTQSFALWAGGMDWRYALVATPLVFLGCAFPNKFKLPLLGEFGGIDLGFADKLSLWRGLLGLSLHGLFNFIGVTAGAVFLHRAWPLVLVASLGISLCYYAVGARTNVDVAPRAPKGLRAGCEQGEALWGALMGASNYLLGAL